jgi:predicted kinase
MVGLPSSGKSTYLHNHHMDCVIVSLDNIRRIFYGHQFHTNAEGYVINDAKNIVRLLLSQGKSVVLDSTATTYDLRCSWRKVTNEFCAVYSIVVLTTPVDVCLKLNSKRPEGKKVPDEVINRMNAAYHDPDLWEGNLKNGFISENIRITRVDWKNNARKTSIKKA